MNHASVDLTLGPRPPTPVMLTSCPEISYSDFKSQPPPLGAEGDKCILTLPRSASTPQVVDWIKALDAGSWIRMMATFHELFQQATEGCDRLPYQDRLATEGNRLPSLLDVPTGLGKTVAAILAWLWRRRFADDNVRSQTPRRLVYCLPMRVLVEQTHIEAIRWLGRIGLLAGNASWDNPSQDELPTRASRLRDYSPDPGDTREPGWAKQHGDRGNGRIAVHLLMGGEEKTDWALWPERDAILIGTQDMLLSRALNRGYAAGRARWPMEFGLLNNDCQWVFDEIQLMDTSLASSLQLDAWRRSLRLRPNRGDFPTPTDNHLAAPCQSLWMSATMAEHWLKSAVDWSPRVEAEWNSRHQLTEAEQTDDPLRSGQLFKINKKLIQPPIAALEKPKNERRPSRSQRCRKETSRIFETRSYAYRQAWQPCRFRPHTNHREHR